MTDERLDALSLRHPCSSCGQPVAADVPSRLAPGAPPSRCTTCGALQTAAPRASPAALETRGASPPVAAAAWKWWVGAASATALIIAGGVLGFSRARELVELVTFDQERVPTAERGAERRQGVFHWRAKTTGDPATAGTACEVAAAVVTNSFDLLDVQMTITCDGRRLYEGSRASGLTCGIHESPGDGLGAWEYDLACTHPPGSNVPRLVFDTRARRADVRVEGSNVPLRLEVVREDGRRGARPLFAASLGFLRWKPERSFLASVVAASGEAPVRAGTKCTARVYAVPLDDLPCRTIVQCDEAILYGGFAQGFTDCVLVKSGPTLVTDDTPSGSDGDPILQMDLANLAATVSDVDPTWSVQLALRPKP